MATIRQLSDVTNPAVQATLNYLAQNLPADYILIPQIKLNPEMSRFIDLLIIAPHVLINVEVKGWFGLIQGDVDAEKVQVRKFRYRNPRPQALAQRKALRAFLHTPAQAERIFEDPRAVFSLNLQATVIFPHPEADVQLEESGEVHCLTLSESVARFTAPDFGANYAILSQTEQSRLADLLLHNLPHNAPVSEDDIISQVLSQAENANHETHFAPLPENPLGTPPSFRVAEDTTPKIEASKVTGPHRVVPSSPKVSMWGTVKSMGKSFVDSAMERIRIMDHRIAVLEGAARGFRVTQHDLLRELERAMEKNRQPTLKAVLVHNHYTVALASEDYQEFQYFLSKAQAELCEQLNDMVLAQEYELLGAINVLITEDMALGNRAFQVTSKFDESIAPPQYKRERTFRPNQQRTVGPYLEVPTSGKKFELNGTLMTIGRQQDNDVSLAEIVSPKMVSRRHAHIKQEGEQFVLYDGVAGQPSSNGTFVNGQALSTTEGHVLQDGQRFILGAVQLVDKNLPLGDSLELIFRNPQAV